MNSKNLAVLLGVVAAVLVVALLMVHNNALKEKEGDVKTITQFSNNLGVATVNLTEQKAVNVTLGAELATRTDEVNSFSNKLATTSSDLDKTRADLDKTAKAARSEQSRLNRELSETKAAAEATEKKLAADIATKDGEIASRDKQITDLNTTKEELDRKITGLNGSIASLNDKIARTQKELDSTKGDKDFLLAELKRMQTEKAGLERQMNDLAFLREQMRELKRELATEQRLDWMRRGLYDQDKKKGGQILNEHFKLSGQTNAGPHGPQLSVELRQDGTVTITPPPTNSPAPPAPK